MNDRTVREFISAFTTMRQLWKLFNVQWDDKIQSGNLKLRVKQVTCVHWQV